MKHPNGIRSHPGLLAIALALVPIVACSWGQKPSIPMPNPADISLYEGLPHQLYEAKTLALEKLKPTIEKGAFPFYRESLGMTEADASALAKILADGEIFRPFTDEKKCGGFHPDYAIVVSSKDSEITYLICFGCFEAKVIGPNRSETRYDLDHNASNPRLSDILKKYRKHRPVPVDSLQDG
jgi:hypothetical protein